MSANGATKQDLRRVIERLQNEVVALTQENRRLKETPESKEATRRQTAIVWKRADVEQVIAEAESSARKTKRTHYVGAIGWPDGSQIYGDGTLGMTDDKELLEGLGTVFATCEPDKTTRHS